MPQERETIRGGLFGEADGITEGLRDGELAVLEAATVVSNILCANYMGCFAIVGGAALLLHGASIQTRDLDLGMTVEAMYALRISAATDNRFTISPFVFEFKSSFDTVVPLDCLEIDGAILHRLTGYFLVGSLPVASLGDLVLAKGAAWVVRGRKKDLDGIEFALGRMRSKSQHFRGLGAEERGLLDEILVELAYSGKGMLCAVIRALL